MNVIVVILRTSGATYRNAYKAHVFRKSGRVQRALDQFCTWNTSWDMDDLVNEDSPTPTKYISPWLEGGKRGIGRPHSDDKRRNVKRNEGQMQKKKKDTGSSNRYCFAETVCVSSMIKQWTRILLSVI